MAKRFGTEGRAWKDRRELVHIPNSRMIGTSINMDTLEKHNTMEDGLTFDLKNLCRVGPIIDKLQYRNVRITLLLKF